MPPFLPRKRVSDTPLPSSRIAPAKKPRLLDVLDADAGSSSASGKAKVFSVDGDSEDSSLSDVDSDEFEDIPSGLKTPVSESRNIPKIEEEDDEDDEEIEWEDAGGREAQSSKPGPLANEDIQLTFQTDDEGPNWTSTSAVATGKKGPTKREKGVRILTHKLHVQYLLGHNAIRNSWLNDKTVQKTLLQQLPTQIKKEIEKWRRASGLPNKEKVHESKTTPRKDKKAGKQKRASQVTGRDWTRQNNRIEIGKADMSHGDPLLFLLKVLSAYWRKRFAVTAPGLRKRGYSTKQALKQEIASLRKDEHDPRKHGERIRDLKEFRNLAERCEGSRDVGAQLFTALLRAIGIEARLVASLQPSGFGWTKAEQMLPRKITKEEPESFSSEGLDSSDSEGAPVPTIGPLTTPAKAKAKMVQKRAPRTRRSNGNKETPISLDTEDEIDDDSIRIDDDDSVVDITPSMPKARAPRFDREVPFPIYWTEAISPVTNKVFPVSPLVIGTSVAPTPELLLQFEPRGAKADKAKIVMAYVVAFASDKTAKDVTTRYLKNGVWPGKTRGFRLPAEKIPIYDKHGRVKRYESYDWFKHVMISFIRPDNLRTAADDLEDSSDLVPREPEKKENKGEGDTLQSLKASADFVLEKHLRREEALRPGAKPDRMFKMGKGDNMKEEPVYRRSDVERCLTAESWHKEGRRPKEGEVPMKMVPVRAVTLTRKREAEEHERMTGEKQLQGLYSWDQTEYIIPPPIRDGIIPKNSYGNMDCFVPSMVPKGAVHIPLRGTVRICKRLEIDFAEAVTGFEFGNKRAVPVCTGVVVAKENEKAVRDAWRIYNEEQRKKEETKMEKLVLDLWRKFIMGLRIRERVEETYGDDRDEHAPDVFHGKSKEDPIDLDDDDKDFPSNADSGLVDEDEMAGGFLLPHENDTDDDDGDRHQLDVIMDHQDEGSDSKKKRGVIVSRNSFAQKKSRKHAVAEEEEDEDDEDEQENEGEEEEGDDDAADDDQDLSSAPQSSSEGNGEDEEYQGPSSVTRTKTSKVLRPARAVRSKYFQIEEEDSE